MANAEGFHSDLVDDDGVYGEVPTVPGSTLTTSETGHKTMFGRFIAALFNLFR